MTGFRIETGIDRGEPFQFTCDEMPVLGYPGESIAAALLASGYSVIRTTPKGQVRGLYCAMGVCWECIVKVDGGPSARAYDTLRTGPQSGNPNPARHSAMMETDLAIVGAGAAGLSTAAAAAAYGVKVLILDDNAAPGGQYFRQLPQEFRRTAETSFDKDVRRGQALFEVLRNPNVTYLPGAVVWDIPDDGGLAFARGSESGRVRAAMIVIAAGAHDRPLPFPGWTLPGVVTAGGLQNLIKGQRVIPGRRAVVAGNGPLVLLAAANLVKAGAKLVEAVEAARVYRRLLRAVPQLLAAPRIVRQAIDYRATIFRSGARLRTGWTVIEARGTNRCEEVVLAPINEAGRVNRSAARALAADLLVLGYGLMPSTEILRICGAKMDWNAERGGWLIRRDTEFETSRRGIFAVGDGSSIGGAEFALAEGRLMGLIAAERLGRLSAAEVKNLKRPVAAQLTRLHRFRRGLEHLYAPPANYLDLLTPETIICRCEEVTAGDLIHRWQEGYVTLNALKSSTRLSMGRCQGRNCLRTMIDLVSRSTNTRPEEVVLPQARPPARPVLISDLLQASRPPIEAFDVETAHLPRGEKIV